jgi:hypothetical protein
MVAKNARVFLGCAKQKKPPSMFSWEGLSFRMLFSRKFAVSEARHKRCANPMKNPYLAIYWQWCLFIFEESIQANIFGIPPGNIQVVVSWST